jgi:hypothetical protein
MILSLADKLLILYAIVQSFLLGLLLGFFVGRYGCGNGYNIQKDSVHKWTEELMRDDHHRHP